MVLYDIESAPAVWLYSPETVNEILVTHCHTIENNCDTEEYQNWQIPIPNGGKCLQQLRSAGRIAPERHD